MMLPPDARRRWEELHRHRPAVLAYVTAKLPGELRASMEPADVVQHTYLNALLAVDDFRPADDDHAVRWLKTVARHVMEDLLREHRSLKRGGGRQSPLGRGGGSASGVGLALELVAAHSRTPSRSAQAREVVALVRAAIDGLPPEYADVLRLRYIGDLDAAAVGGRLGKSAGAVRVMCHRATIALRERLLSMTMEVP